MKKILVTSIIIYTILIIISILNTNNIHKYEITPVIEARALPTSNIPWVLNKSRILFMFKTSFECNMSPSDLYNAVTGFADPSSIYVLTDGILFNKTDGWVIKIPFGYYIRTDGHTCTVYTWGWNTRWESLANILVADFYQSLDPQHGNDHKPSIAPYMVLSRIYDKFGFQDPETFYQVLVNNTEGIYIRNISANYIYIFGEADYVYYYASASHNVYALYTPDDFKGGILVISAYFNGHVSYYTYTPVFKVEINGEQKPVELVPYQWPLYYGFFNMTLEPNVPYSIYVYTQAAGADSTQMVLIFWR